MHTFERTGLWRRSLGDTTMDEHFASKERLRVAFSLFRGKAAALTSRIVTSLPELTIHDITHLDALWETADIIAGDGYPLNPMEAFVFGAAVLLHDAGLCIEAYEGGLPAIRRTTQWRDAYALESRRSPSAPVAEIQSRADFAALRALHANQATSLVERVWIDPDTKDQLFLIDDSELRKHYGTIIGSIASSHHWPIEEWPAPGSEDTALGVLMEPEVGHGASEIYTRVQA
jgi:hypothetical protein